MVSALETQALRATAKLVQKNEDELILELGRRLQAVSLDAGIAGDFEPRLAETLGPLDDLKANALRFAHMISEQAFGIVCGVDEGGQALRQAVADAVSEGAARAAAAVAAVLIGSLGLAPTIAAPLAALLVKQFLKATYKATCTAWGQSLKTGTAAPGSAPGRLPAPA